MSDERKKETRPAGCSAAERPNDKPSPKDWEARWRAFRLARLKSSRARLYGAACRRWRPSRGHSDEQARR
jgi:hypothetical protein